MKARVLAKRTMGRPKPSTLFAGSFDSSPHKDDTTNFSSRIVQEEEKEEEGREQAQEERTERRPSNSFAQPASRVNFACATRFSHF
jgi:hypothetical protein